MNIKHSQLESARKNPAFFKSHTQSVDSVYSGGKSRYRLLQLAIFHYHNSANNVNEGLRYLRSGNRSYGFANGAKLRELEKQFEDYVVDFDNLGTTVIQSAKRLKLAIGPDIFLTGEVPRLDLQSPRGYIVCFLQKFRVPWRQELRFPVLQKLFADEWGCPITEVSLGMYSFKPHGYEIHSYSAEDVNKAQQEIIRLVKVFIAP